MGYADFIDMLLRDEGLLRKLHPVECPDIQALLKIRGYTARELAGARDLKDAVYGELLKCALLFLVDAMDEAHRVVQEMSGDDAAYWHGMIHRREGDFDNARYWFRRAGALPWFGALHSEVSKVSGLFASQSQWDPYLFTGQCEQEKFGAEELRDDLVRIQRIEFMHAMDYVWRCAVE